MRRVTLGLAILGGLLATPAKPQDVVLKGKVWEPILASGVPGADVILTRSDNTTRKTTSGAGGAYSFKGLSGGEHVTVTCRRNDFVPDPRAPDEVVLAQSETDHTLELYSSDASRTDAYMTALAMSLQASVKQRTSDPKKQAEIYSRTWESLAALGFPAESRALAARAILPLIPPDAKGAAAGAATRQRMAQYAAADPHQLAQFESQIDGVIDGTGHLSVASTGLSPELSADVVASKLGNADPAARTRVVTEYSRTSGAYSGKLNIDSTNTIKTGLGVNSLHLSGVP